MRKVLPYNVKKAYLMMLLALGLTPTFTSCEKDDPINPNAQKIKELELAIARLTPQVRAAVEPAKNEPYHISISFNNTLEEQARRLGIYPLKDISDSSKAFVPTADTLMSFGGQYANPENMTTLRDLSAELCAKKDSLVVMQR